MVYSRMPCLELKCLHLDVQHNKKREELHRLKEKFPEAAAKLDQKGVAALLEDDDDLSSSEEEVSFNAGEPKDGRMGTEVE